MPSANLTSLRATASRHECPDQEVTYLFDNQVSLVPEQPVRLTKGEVRRVEGGSVATGVEPGRDQFVVLSSLRYTLDGARCV